MRMDRYRFGVAFGLLTALALVAGACVPAAPTAPAPPVSGAPTTVSSAQPAVTAAGVATAAVSTPAAPTGAGASPLATPAAVALTITPGALTTARTSTAPAATGTAAAATSASGTPAPPGTPPAAGAAATPLAAATGPAQLNEATFTAVEYSYQGPSSIPGGWTRLTLTNKGQQPHDLVLYKIAAGRTISDVVTALASQTAPSWAQAYGNVSAAPGASASYVVNLVPGNYVMLSFGQPAANQPPDAARGMLRQLTVTAPVSPATAGALPKADAIISMADYTFVITGTLRSGNQTVRLDNVGQEIHEAVFLRLKPGKTMADVQKAMQAQAGGQSLSPDQLPFEGMPGGTMLSPHLTAFINPNLQPGDYVLACFIPSPSHGGQPHAALGMIRQVTVQ